MKKLIVFLFVFVNTCSAQTYDEWFRQKKTQKKYLLQQIAALQIYVGYAEKGYSIARAGLTTIHSIKDGDFHLHNDHFNSLTTVNPKVQKYSKVASIIAMQVSITKQVHAAIKNCKELTAAELNYLRQVFNNVLDDCGKDLDELSALITNGEQQMKDDERIKRIDKLYEDMQDRQIFVQSFSHSAEVLCIQGRSDQYDITIEKKLNELK